MEMKSNKPIVVTTAAILINLASGGLYAWSIFAAALIKQNGWTKSEAMLPYTVALVMLEGLMVPGGRLYDRFSPLILASAGGILIMLGMVAAGF
jgi:hypothetical protein